MSQIIRFSCPKIGPTKRPAGEEVEMDVGDAVSVMFRRRARVAVLVDEDVAGDPERQEVDRGPEMIWSTFRLTDETACISASTIPPSAAPTQRDHPAKSPPSVRPDDRPDAEERAGEDHPLERRC